MSTPAAPDVISSNDALDNDSIALTGIYRPPQWGNGPAMVAVTVPGNGGQDSSSTASLTASQDVPGSYLLTTAPAVATTTYVFDAVLELEHDQRLEKTHHPVQTGADISSHAYLMPARLSMYIGMSDAMDAYASGNNAANQTTNATPDNVTPFTGNPSKSVSAYQQMLTLQAARQPLTVTTRLRTYTNMVVVSVSPREDYKTITGLRMRVEFEQIFSATTSSAPVSARADDTQSSGLGSVSPSAVPAVTQTQFQIPQTQYEVPLLLPNTPYTIPINDLSTDYTANIPGAGAFSSVPGQQGLP